MGRVAILGPLALLIACASGMSGPSSSKPLTAGSWGGPDASLVVDSKGASAEFNCSHGAIEEAVLLKDDGSFQAKGYWVREGGPTPEHEDRRPAAYSGTSEGRILTLRVNVPDPPRDLGPFTLTLGQAAVLHKCD